MAKKKEFFEKLVQMDLFEDVSDVFGDDGVIEESGEWSLQHDIEDKDPGNKTRGFRA
jgi:hypothetical protein